MPSISEARASIRYCLLWFDRWGKPVSSHSEQGAEARASHRKQPLGRSHGLRARLENRLMTRKCMEGLTSTSYTSEQKQPQPALGNRLVHRTFNAGTGTHLGAIKNPSNPITLGLRVTSVVRHERRIEPNGGASKSIASDPRLAVC